MGPAPQIIWREAGQSARQKWACRAIAPNKSVERFGMGEIEAAAPGHQKFAGGRGHAVINRHRKAFFGKAFRCKEPGRPCAHNGD